MVSHVWDMHNIIITAGGGWGSGPFAGKGKGERLRVEGIGWMGMGLRKRHGSAVQHLLCMQMAPGSISGISK